LWAIILIAIVAGIVVIGAIVGMIVFLRRNNDNNDTNGE
jgi:heme/copper-type cytochrome/quinol oxidase subunit 2